MFEDTIKFKIDLRKHSPHTKILGYIDHNSSVLDVGCSSGYLGRELKKKGCLLTGIEAAKEEAMKAKAFYDNLIVADVEQTGSKLFPPASFDFILYLDVLEHLKRPDLVLERFAAYLKPGGKVIASIPNIARLEYRLRHLFGNFDYDEGILYRDHLRFFTLKTAKELFLSSGYKIIDVDYTGLASKLRVLPNLLAWQFIISAVRNTG